MRWFCIEAHFLTGHYHGCSDERRRFSEWPPNPNRLFQALLAAANLGFRRTEFSDAKKEAFRWLERRGAPEIIAAQEHEMSVMRLYVPNNDMDKVARAWARNVEPEKQPNELRTDKDLRPHRLDGDATVRVLWPIADDEWEEARPYVEVLCAEARHLHALGLGIDLVAGNGRIFTAAEKHALPGEVWMSDADGIGWRMPIQGSLDELLARYREQRRRAQAGRGGGVERSVAPPSPPKIFGEIGYVRRAAGRDRPVHAFALVDAEGAYRSFDPRRAIEVAAWLRHAAHERARGMKLDDAFIERFVCGHGEDANAKSDRFSYLPLPTIPAAGRDGRIRRVLIAEPFGGGGSRAQALARRLSGISLAAEDASGVMADLRTLANPADDGVTRRYLPRGGACRWASITPIVLPGRDNNRSRKAYKLVLKALAQAGYATPMTEIHLQPEPVFPGAEMARNYRVPSYLAQYTRAHAIIIFAQPVPGPVALGAGRHIGLGLFAALE